MAFMSFPPLDRCLWFRVKVQLLYRNMQRSQGGLVFKAHRLLYHSTLGLKVIKRVWDEEYDSGITVQGSGDGLRMRCEPIFRNSVRA